MDDTGTDWAAEADRLDDLMGALLNSINDKAREARREQPAPPTTCPTCNDTGIVAETGRGSDGYGPCDCVSDQ